MKPNLTAKQASVILGCSLQHVYWLTKKGRLKTAPGTPEGKYLYSQSVVDKFKLKFDAQTAAIVGGSDG